MSQHAYRIELARRLHAAALNTPAEAAAKANLELIIADSRERDLPAWCCASGCRHCAAWAVCK